MPMPIAEFFGFAAEDTSTEATRHREEQKCPFLQGPCVKKSNGIALGTCSVHRRTGPVVICPKRFSARGEELPRIIAREAEPGSVLAVVPEVPLGSDLGRMDWVLTRLTAEGHAVGPLYGVEAQAVDTTGSLRPYVDAYFAGRDWNAVRHPIGINWRNVWKRIVPQILRKGRLMEAQHSRLYVVMQDVLVDYLRGDMRLEEARPGEDANVVFYAFRLRRVAPGPGYELVLRDIFKTTLRHIEHAMSDVARLPTRADLVERVERRVREAGIRIEEGVPVVVRRPEGAKPVDAEGMAEEEVEAPGDRLPGG